MVRKERGIRAAIESWLESGIPFARRTAGEYGNSLPGASIARSGRLSTAASGQLLLVPLAISNSLKELLLVGLIVLIPTVPVTLFAWSFLGRRRNRRGVSEEREIEAGRSPATPFAMISIVGTVIAVAAMTVLLLVIAIRAVAA